jgi:hypothetical protein
MKKGYIYKITSPTGKIYIGKTTNINNRKSSYRSLLCKSQRILYNSLVKHGFETHNFEIVKEGLFSKEELSKLETYYIIHFSSFVRWNDSGMNLTLGGEGCTVVHHSEQTKKKISESKKGKPPTQAQKDYYQKQIGRKLKKSDEWIKKNAESIKKPIIQKELDGNVLKHWNSAKDVEEVLGYCRKNISCNLRGKTKTAYGYIWEFKTSTDNISGL